MLFQLQQFFFYEMQLTPIRQALENWTSIWQVYSTTFARLERHTPVAHENLRPDNMWRRIGFSRFCPEYWLLAKLITERLSLPSPTGDHNVLDGFNGISSGPDHSTEPSEVLLPQYDETSMKQINKLIADFQAIIL